MELLVRPSRNKHRSNAVAAMRLLDRREKVTQLEEQLSLARAELSKEETSLEEKCRVIKEKLELLEQEELESSQLFEANERVRESTLSDLDKDIKECQLLETEQREHLLQMEKLERILTELTDKLELLQSYQSTISDVEGFDRVVAKFQELNETWQYMAEEYRSILVDASKCAFVKGHPTAIRMNVLFAKNGDDNQRVVQYGQSTDRNKTARNAQWQIFEVTESFKQHGHIYLAIINLASHLSSHPIAKTLMNIGNSKSKSSAPKSNRSQNPATARKEIDRAASVEQIIVPVQSYRERWRTLAAAAIGTDASKGHNRTATNLSLSSDMGKNTDSVSNIEIQQSAIPVPTAMSHKQSVVNKVATGKLNFIEQILCDLTLIKDEIEFQTDPIHYNEPVHSFA